jgi:hypothetical protein
MYNTITYDIHHTLQWISEVNNNFWPSVVVHTCNPNYSEGRDRRIAVWHQPKQKEIVKLCSKNNKQNQDLIWKITKEKKWGGVTRGMAQVPSKHKVLSSNASPIKKKKKSLCEISYRLTIFP